ncbi:UV-stimulated scaffold protein A [Tetranychus urticae]|uniref:UV-stimulated scaffold protein A C-terminal domain-containing protein n=1 Tax=Tetranychus urticae TaxID=32264 RepID=T1K4C3_TETUR|nr:UV-stimulated scaffold protein A [Tetranychus urticae]
MANHQEVGALVEKLTTSGRKDLDPEAWNKLKLICKEEGDSVIEQIFHMLIFQSSRKHSQIRYCSLLLIDELFKRSHRFRTLLLRHDNLNSFIETTLGVNEDKPLPPPKAWAKELKKKSIECIDCWHDKFKDGYASLRSLYTHYSQNCINFRQREIVQQNERVAQEAEREREVVSLKREMDIVNEQFSQIKESCESHLAQILNCFQLLYPGIQKEDIFSEEDLSEVSTHLTVTRSDVPVVVRPYIEIVKNSENEDLIQNLKDVYHDIVSSSLPKIKSSLKEMAKGPEFCKNEMKQAIDLKNQLMTAIQKFIELKIVKKDEQDQNEVNGDSSRENSKEGDDSSSEEDEEFEEVEDKEGLETIIPQHRRKEYGLDEDLPTDQPCSSRSLSGPMCKAPLRNGKLCPRRDARKCPFHGLIIPRDEVGQPLNEEDKLRETKEKQSDVPDWQDPEYLKDLEAQIGIDLTVNKKGKGKSKSKVKIKALQDIKTCDDTPRKRLKKKIFNKDAQERLARDLDSIDDRRSLQFEDQWSYALNS